MAYDALPGVTANFPDGGLKIQRNADFGDSVLVIGTAEDGPSKDPIMVQNLDQLEDVFGRFGQGTLVRSAYEVWNTTDTPVDVRAMRIGNGAKATLGIKEASGYITYEFASSPSTASGVADPSFSASGRVDQFIDALTLTAKYDGSKYNSFTLRTGYDDDANSENYGQHCVLVYNPFTGGESSFSYDYYNTGNTAVDVHNVTELVDAINADSGINPYIGASTTDLNALYEICASGTTAGTPAIIPSSGAVDVNYYESEDIPTSLQEGSAIQTQWNADSTPKKVTIYLNHITTSPDNSGDGIPDAILAPEPTYGIPPVIKVGPIGMTWSSNIPTAGNQLIDLLVVYEVAEASGELLGTAGTDTATLANYPVNRNESQAPGSVAGNTIISYIGDSTTTSEYKQYVRNGLVGVSTDGTTSVFQFKARLEPDIVTWAGAAVDIPSVDHDATTAGKDVPVRIYETIAGVTGETRKPCQLSWTGGTATITFTTATELPTAGTIITIDYLSTGGTMTEYDTRTALENTRGSTNAEENYFVAGNQMYFGGPHDTDIKLTYQYKRDYDIPGDVSVTDHTTGKIEFTNPGKVPQIHGAHGTRIGLNYTYRPEWINPTGTEALAGGGNGTSMTNLQLKDELAAAYTALENYEVDIIVPEGAYLDASVESYSTETGILQEVNAGFHTQLADLLDTIAENVGETIGIIGVRPADSNSVSDVGAWVTKLTVPDSNDRLRAANYMPTFSSKWVQIVAAEPVISAGRLGVAGVDYITTGENIYAGLIPSLPAQIATTNKYIGRSLLGLRYSLSKKQLNDLVTSRYVCFYNKSGQGPTVVKDVTAAAVDSDYNRLTTLRIAKLVMDIIREVADPYIGNLNTVHKRNSMKTALVAALFNLTQGSSNALRDFDLKITSSAEEQRQGTVNVDCTIVPVFTMERIKVTVRLRNAI